MRVLAWFGTNDMRMIGGSVHEITNPEDIIVRVTLICICASPNITPLSFCINFVDDKGSWRNSDASTRRYPGPLGGDTEANEGGSVSLTSAFANISTLFHPSRSFVETVNIARRNSPLSETTLKTLRSCQLLKP